MAEADIGSKQTINIYNRAWAEWVLQEQQIDVEAELSGEFQFIGRTSDSLLQVQGKDGRFLVLSEIQLSYDARMPYRLAAYAALARHKYQQDVFVTVVYLLRPPDSATILEAFHSDFMGQVGHQDFQVIGLWDLDAEQVLSFNNPALLPFVPLMHGGASEQILRRCATRIRREPRALELETILAVFASHVMDAEAIRRILRWEMGIIQESPLLQELLEERYEQGQVEGIHEGRVEATIEWLNRALTMRFNVSPAYLAGKDFQQYELDKLENLGEVAITAATLAEFEAYLDTLE